MTAQEFCCWLQGFMELAGPTTMTKEQVDIVRDHLQLVFRKETPVRGLNDVSPWAGMTWGINSVPLGCGMPPSSPAVDVTPVLTVLTDGVKAPPAVNYSSESYMGVPASC